MSSKEHEHTEDSGKSREAGDGAERTRPDAAADGVPGGARTSGRSRAGRSVPAGRGAASGENAGAAEGRPRRARLRLPFDNRREDAGEWAYDHRIGLCITLIAYLVLMIAFVSSKIVVGRRPHQQGMFIDLQSLAELEQERDRLAEEVRRRQQEGEEIDWRSIRNEVSNENALNEKLRDDRGTNAAALNDAAAEAEARMRANREAYEQGLAEERAIREGRRGREEGRHEDRKVKGRVTVSFSLKNPVRQSVDLSVPAYRCEGGGEVVVAIVVNRAGEVVSARVAEGPACRARLVLQYRLFGPGASAGDHHLHLHSAVSRSGGAAPSDPLSGPYVFRAVWSSFFTGGAEYSDFFHSFAFERVVRTCGTVVRAS